MILILCKILFRSVNGQPSVIGEKKFYAFATDVNHRGDLG